MASKNHPATGKENFAFEKENQDGTFNNGMVVNEGVGHFPAKKEVKVKNVLCEDHYVTVSAPQEVEIDPFAVVDDFTPTGPTWDELNTVGKVKRLATTFTKIVLLLCLLYLFICSLGFLQSAFQLLGGKAAGEAFTNNVILSNMIAGLMIGVLATVLLQSSSTTTSIVVAMVASGIMKVRPAIPIVMGANIGTSVTNTLVAISQIGDKEQFRRAFAGATVHDMFNFLCVIILLPLEAVTGYLFHLTSIIVNAMDLQPTGKTYTKEFLTVITNPFTKLIIQLDESSIISITTGDKKSMGKSLIKQWCDAGNTTTHLTNVTINGTLQLVNETTTVHHVPCKFLLHGINLSDHIIGVLLLVIALVILCTCLITIVKLLHSLLRGQIAVVIRKTFNSDFPKPFGFLTGYAAILVGAGMTVLVQSSSIFTSALTPLVGMGLVTVERIFPLTLGANIGTTATGILAAMASKPDMLAPALQIAFCHLFFNVSGILLWYPIPQLRKIPTNLARGLGNTTATYRWFAVAYLIFCFFILPFSIFALSMAGPFVLIGICSPIIAVLVMVGIINILQRKRPEVLPRRLRSWSGVPKGLRSLEPYDKVFSKICSASTKMKSKSIIVNETKETKETSVV